MSILDSIKSDHILNRRMIFEVRYHPNPSIIDMLGGLINKIIASKLISNAHWEMGLSDIKITDGASIFPPTVFTVDHQRFNFNTSTIQTNDSFFNAVTKLYEEITNTSFNIEILRIGCRIQGSYKCNSKTHESILKKFSGLYPAQFLFEDFPVKDTSLTLHYQNGFYVIGPVMENDTFMGANFPGPDTNLNPGFAIDTDNYMVRSKEKPTLKIAHFKDVYMATLAVEKRLFDNLKDL